MDREHVDGSNGGLAAWRGVLLSGVPGAATAARLEQRPVLIDSDDEAVMVEQADALLDSLIARQRLMSHLAARQQADLDRLARQYPGLREHLATEVGLALGVAESTADKYLDDAGSIRRLPATFAALNAGQITPFKATVIRLHTEHVSEEVARKVEQRVVPAAGRQTMPELREACTRAVLRCDPAGSEDRHEKAKAGRGMSRRHLPDGMALLFIESAAQDIATVFEACTALGAAARVKGDQRTADQRRMDALTDVCRDILDTGRWTPNQPIPASPTGDGENRSAGESGSADAAEPADTPGPAGAAEAVEPAAGPGSVDTAAADDASDPGAAADPTRFEVAVCPRPPVILPERGSRRPHILVTVPAATLAGGNQPGYLAGHGPITAGQARTIAADGDLTPADLRPDHRGPARLRPDPLPATGRAPRLRAHPGPHLRHPRLPRTRRPHRHRPRHPVQARPEPGRSDRCRQPGQPVQAPPPRQRRRRQHAPSPPPHRELDLDHRPGPHLHPARHLTVGTGNVSRAAIGSETGGAASDFAGIARVAFRHLTGQGPECASILMTDGLAKLHLHPSSLTCSVAIHSL